MRLPYAAPPSDSAPSKSASPDESQAVSGRCSAVPSDDDDDDDDEATERDSIYSRETLQNGENSRQEPESPPPTGAPWTIDEKHQQASEASRYAAYSSAIEANYPDALPSTSGAAPSGLSLPPEPGTSGESTM